jgi:8-oxo-dGTP diphosphatase
MSDYKHWVVGFVFKNRDEVTLVMKNRPEWQKGKLNGVGGKIEAGETSAQAMRREFKEEAGADIPESA